MDPSDEVADDTHAQASQSSGPDLKLKPTSLPLLPIRKRVLLPGGLLRLTIGRPKSVRLVDSLWDANNRTFRKGALVAVHGVVTAGEDEGKDPQGDEPLITPEDEKDVSLKRLTLSGGTVVFAVGTAAKVLQLQRVNNKDSTQWSMLVEGLARVVAKSVTHSEPFFIANVDWPPTRVGPSEDTEVRALAINLRQTSKELLELLKRRSQALGTKTKEVLESVDKSSPELLADVLTSANGDATMKEKQTVLGHFSLVQRLRRALELLHRQVNVLQISEKIQSTVDGKLKNTQREFYLRQQLKAINEELGNKSGEANEVDEIVQLENTLKGLPLPQEARQAVDREMNRLRNMQPQQPEYSVVRTYLETMAELPWGKSTKDNLDVAHAQRQLDDDHFGLDKVKKRMVEFLAVRSLKRDSKGPILCLVGPPGVGKTSLGRSVATALGRQFRRLALGGVRDEAEIRGHRRTYIGALPGNIITAVRKAGSNNPVILLDEVDKLGRDVRGDPGAALLEVLDPEQNGTFTDHYLNVPFDLSKIMFIATANDVSTIPAPLLDRMELIEVPGYSMYEKVQIAMRHLVPKQMERHGITDEHLVITEDAVTAVLEGYTREAGVRQLDRELATMCRGVAVKVAEARDRFKQQQHQEQVKAAFPAGVDTVPDEVTNEVVGGGRDSASPAGASTGTATTTAAAAAAAAGKEDVPEDDGPLQLLGFERVVLTREGVAQLLGPHRFENEVASRVSVPGVATGMAWTQVGGEILFIEVSLSRGSGRIQITGRLGETMQESVKTALSYVRAHAVELGLNTHRDHFGEDIERALRRADLHVHFPQGATPKDGPSAGVAITAALVSALSGLCVRNDTACTGEVTLRGLVLPIGGVKEKVLAAHRAGIKRVVLPARNEKDTLEIPKRVRDDMQIIFVSTIMEAMGALFDPDVKPTLPAWRIRVQEAKDEERRAQRLGKRVFEDPEEAGVDEADKAGGRAPAQDFSGEVLQSKI